MAYSAVGIGLVGERSSISWVRRSSDEHTNASYPLRHTLAGLIDQAEWIIYDSAIPQLF